MTLEPNGTELVEPTEYVPGVGQIVKCANGNRLHYRAGQVYVFNVNSKGDPRTCLTVPVSDVVSFLDAEELRVATGERQRIHIGTSITAGLAFVTGLLVGWAAVVELFT